MASHVPALQLGAGIHDPSTSKNVINSKEITVVDAKEHTLHSEEGNGGLASAQIGFNFFSVSTKTAL